MIDNHDILMIHTGRRTKIVATLGPASSSEEVIRELIEAGVDMFRLNMSHGTRDVHEKNAHIVRKLQRELGANVAIMIDLQGPKIRIGTFANKSVTLLPGAKFRLDLDTSPGNANRVYLPHPEIINALMPDTEILLDDGKLKLKVVGHHGDSVDTIVMDGGSLSNRKGVSVPGIVLPISAITDKDRTDAGILNEVDADWLAVSFVQTADDIELARDIVGPNINILAKIEKPSAVSNIDSIVQAADAIMVARGDLGVEMPFESIPRVQKMLVDTARAHSKPCIVATQMLESMISCHRPTRAEVSDVAHAVLEGADAVMLSAETASGKYPVEAVKTMAKIIIQTERDQAELHANREMTGIDPIANAVSMIAAMDHIRTIVVFTESGRSANSIAAARPDANIIALTTSQRTARRLCMSRGVTSVVSNEIFGFSQMLQIVQKTLVKMLDIDSCEKVIIVAGLPFRESGPMNLIHICRVDKGIADHDNGS
ncbi:MAG: pyruvate kinase [Holosporales bacterium]|jgi:pyruvate kinase|nr:pyruvate kinase [Holosporales bacterium]